MSAMKIPALLLGLATAAAAQQLSPCEPPNVPGPVLCGFIEAPADHAKPDSPTLRLRVVVLKATESGAASDPFLYLAGGPGAAATDTAAPLAEQFAALRRHRDIVLIDQRGTGDSVPYNCTLTATDGRPAALTSSLLPPQMIEVCAKGPGPLSGAPTGTDARLFTTAQSADDLASVAAALGYGQLNLYGVSYGTRLGLVFLNRHPGLVRTLALQGVVLPNEPIPVSATWATQQALNRLMDDCKADSLCAGSFPEFRRQLTTLLTERTQQSGVLSGAVTAALYSTKASAALPAAVAEAAQGNYRRLLSLAGSTGAGGTGAANTGGMSNGVYLSILCAEDTPFITDADLDRLARQTFAGDGTVRALMRTCQPWPRGAVAEEDRRIPSAAKPVLLLSGEVDPITPPDQAQEAADTLPASRHVILKGTGHAGAANDCAVEMVMQLVDSADPARVGAACAAAGARPRWVTPLPEPLQ